MTVAIGYSLVVAHISQRVICIVKKALTLVETHHMRVMLKGLQSCGEVWEEVLNVLLQVSVIHCGNMIIIESVIACRRF